jgi:uncharacterized membrane protein YqhA
VTPGRPPEGRRGRTAGLEATFERALWSGRLLVVVAVVVTVLLAVAALALATLDAVYTARLLGSYADPGLAGDARDELRTQVVSAIIKSLDGYLIAGLLLIVALGLYELFVNPIDPAAGSSSSRRLLQVRDLEDLKQRVAKLVVLVLVVEFFQQALRVPIRGALELLWLGLGILVVAWPCGSPAATRARRAWAPGHPGSDPGRARARRGGGGRHPLAVVPGGHQRLHRAMRPASPRVSSGTITTRPRVARTASMASSTRSSTTSGAVTSSAGSTADVTGSTRAG